jgi:hypothetical protein
LAPGYFHQVTALQGRVVGWNLGPFDFRWLRESFSVNDAILTLYEYRWPAKIQDRKRIAVLRSDSRGNFDFGRVAPGHYSLVIEVPNSDVVGGWFDVEITEKVSPTDSVLLDISPLHPDCTGGNEFIEKKIKNAASH